MSQDSSTPHTDPSADSEPTPVSTPPAPAGPLVARAGRYFRNTRYLMVLLVMGFGAWCIHDGWVGWPNENRTLEQVLRDLETARQVGDEASVDRLSAQRDKLKHHTDMDLNIQKFLGLMLPPLGVLLLIRALYMSRGEYRLEEDVLRVPGHPPIPVDAITSIDRKMWDRKGILYVWYQLADGANGRLKLDDFIYDRAPTDAIVDRIMALTSAGTTVPTPNP